MIEVGKRVSIGEVELMHCADGYWRIWNEDKSDEATLDPLVISLYCKGSELAYVVGGFDLNQRKFHIFNVKECTGLDYDIGNELAGFIKESNPIIYLNLPNQCETIETEIESIKSHSIYGYLSELLTEIGRGELKPCNAWISPALCLIMLSMAIKASSVVPKHWRGWTKYKEKLERESSNRVVNPISFAISQALELIPPKSLSKVS